MSKRWSLVSAAVLLAAACGCGRSEAPPQQPQAEPPARIKVSYRPFLSYGPFFIAIDEGYFAEQNLDVELVPISRTPHVLPSLTEGELDVVAGSINAGILNLIARGGMVKIVAGKGYADPDGCPYVVALARREVVEQGMLEDPEKLRRLKICANRDNSAGYFLDRAFARYGLTLDDLEISIIPPAARLDAMAKGSVDIVYSNEPWTTRLVQAGHSVPWITDSELLPDFQFAFISFGPSLLTQRPDVGRRFLTAYLKAVRQFRLGKTERNLEILERHTELDRELLQAVCWPPLRADGGINVQSVLDFQDWAFERKLLDRKLAADEFWDPAPIEAANRALGGGGE